MQDHVSFDAIVNWGPLLRVEKRVVNVCVYVCVV